MDTTIIIVDFEVLEEDDWEDVATLAVYNPDEDSFTVLLVDRQSKYPLVQYEFPTAKKLKRAKFPNGSQFTQTDIDNLIDYFKNKETEDEV